MILWKVSKNSLFKIPQRALYSLNGKWGPTYNNSIREDLEKAWRPKLQSHDQLQKSIEKSGEKYYVLSMFPYPSGALHMGHVRVYTISDSMARFQQLRGKKVIHPMGWDAFGLPAENAAIERGELPSKWTYSNIEAMKKQLDQLVLSFEWDRGYATCDSNYYKWTQYIFLKMREAGLVYQKSAPVNWDPVDQTVLADEQIDDEGRSWRSGAIVERKFLKQWYIKTTAFSKSLYDGLENVDPELWKDIIALQKHWIGTPDGVRVEFELQKSDEVTLDFDDKLSVFTRNITKIYAASHLFVSSDHVLNNEMYYKKNGLHTDEFIELDVYGVHPLTNKHLPIFVAFEKDFGEFLDSHIGIWCCDESDNSFVDKYKLDKVKVIDNENKLIHSGEFSGVTEEAAEGKILEKLKSLHRGGDVTSERGRDWLISRQRYWGTPIPIIHCDKYGTQPVPYDQLPVQLPVITEFSGKGSSPLSTASDWLKVKCPKCDCDGFGRRETDTMDTFVDSSWYFLRYLSPGLSDAPFSEVDAKRDMPVDLYIGGKEHAIMHLYYARFFSHFLYNEGLLPQKEPFVNLLTQGMVMGRSYRRKQDGRYLRPEQVDCSGKEAVEISTGDPVIVDWEKMSKSKYNGVDPQAVIDEFGVEATRLCILSGVAPKSDRNWDISAMQGVTRWQARIWSLVTDFRNSKCNVEESLPENIQELENELFEIRNLTVKDVTFHMNQTFLISTAISRLHILTNALKKIPAGAQGNSYEFERALAELVIMISPFAPMFASELWLGLSNVSSKLTYMNWDQSVLEQSWPKLDDSYRLSMKIKKNNKKELFSVKLPMPLDDTGSMTKEMAVEITRAHPEFSAHFSESDISVKNASLLIVPGVRAELNFVCKDKKNKNKKIKANV